MTLQTQELKGHVAVDEKQDIPLLFKIRKRANKLLTERQNVTPLM